MTQTTSRGVREFIGTWTVDPAHSVVAFAVKHMMISTVRGSFLEFEGGLTIADPVEDSEAWATIKAGSITTNDSTRDGHLKSADFLLTAEHPELTFRSTRVEVIDDSHAKLRGDFTVRGVTKPLTLDVTFNDYAPIDPWGNERISFTASGKINREDFGASWNQALETGGVLVGKEVRLEIEVSAVRPRN